MDGYNSNLIDLGDGKVVVLRIKDHIAAARMPFNDAEKIIEPASKSGTLGNTLEEESARLFKNLEQGISIASEQKRYGSNWVILNQVNRFATNVDPAILKEIFRLRLSPDKKPSVGLIDLGKKGSALISVDKIYPGPLGNLNSPKDLLLKKETEEKIGAFEYFLWIDSLYRNAKIKLEPLGSEENSAN